MKKILRNYRIGIIKSIILVFTIVFVSVAVVQVAFGIGNAGTDTGGDADEGGGSLKGCGDHRWSKSWGGCTSSNHSFWIKIDAPSDDMPFWSMHSWQYDDQVIHGGKAYFSNLRQKVRGQSIRNCHKYGGAAYLLVRNLYYGNHEPYGLMAGEPLSEGIDYKDDSGDNWGVGEKVSWADAEAAFNRGAPWDDDNNDTTINFQAWNRSSNLTWFCADYHPESSKKKTTSSPPYRKLNCGGYGSQDKGDTETRIAVQNMSLDGSYDPTDVNGDPVEWKATGNRSGIDSDSMYSREGADVYTLAKPGDSIRFYHAVCMAVRYGRRTVTQGSWTTWQEHDTVYDLPDNWMTINADPEEYVFEDVDVWNNFAEQVEKVDAYENLFSSAGAGSKVSDEKDAIDIINPTPGIEDYTCNSIYWYRSNDPFIPGGYHIPGFKAEKESCQSASKTGISQATGTTISQWHQFNALRMWEKYSNTHGGSCSCGDPGAYLTGNYTADTYDDAWEGDEHSHRKEYQCDEPGTNNCNCSEYDEYDNCIGVYQDYIYSLTEDSYQNEYTTDDEGDDEHPIKWATVYVPYNYETVVTSKITNDDVVFQGSSVTAKYDWDVVPRHNDKTAPDWAGYATSTPDTGRPNETQVVMFEWLYYPGTQKVEGEPYSTVGPEAYYSSGMVEGTYKVIKTASGDQNPHGYYVGDHHSDGATRTVPDNDEYVGYKYCTAVAFYPSDSHNNKGNSLDIQKETGDDGAMDAGERWNISGASCRTIAKKPNFQVWNGSVYTEGSINTSISQKWTGQPMGQDYSSPSTDVFGSWADYAIVANGENKTMASGAMLGYNNLYYDFRGKTGKPYASTSQQGLAVETIANDSAPTGKSGINASASYSQNLYRLESRYKDKTITLLNELNKTQETAGKTIYTTKTGMQVANVVGDVSISDLGLNGGGNPNANTLTNDSSNGLVKKLGDGINDNTLVIVASGTVTIDRNICYIGNCNDDATKLITYTGGVTNITEAAKLPQILIFAHDIDIAEDVTRVDAWLIASTNDGTISTCAGHMIGGDYNTSNVGLVARDASPLGYTKGNCGLTLVINGPVFANHIDLLRTAGAFHGYSSEDDLGDPRYRSVGATGNGDRYKGSATPAEIFNLRADAYIWAYNQAQRYSEAVVTYTRELAPRY